MKKMKSIDDPRIIYPIFFILVSTRVSTPSFHLISFANSRVSTIDTGYYGTIETSHVKGFASCAYVSKG